MVARAFLGIFEGGTMPGIAFFLSCFYRREELLFRIGIFVSGSSMAGAFGGLLATGLSSIPRWGVAATPIYRWRNIFFFEGLVSINAFLLHQRLSPMSLLVYRRRSDVAAVNYKHANQFVRSSPYSCP